jgi:hypothetical protein
VCKHTRKEKKAVSYCVQALSEGGPPAGALDDAAENILPLLEGQPFGVAAGSVELTGFAHQHREACSIKAVDIYQLI